ncbi:MAG: GNAT family N-acetyltransferase [Leptolyngbyaceae cyanobacterium MO_188.B28]|nr:GNAT family N-acetyltransferase [Leptolyngbyaceae cyanobacterium MO_188.B28]
MSQQIFDKKGRRYLSTIVEVDSQLLINLYNQHMVVGQVRCIRESSAALMLKDIAIANEVNLAPMNIWFKILHKIPGWRSKPINYRRQGLGSALIRRLIQYARENGIEFLHGEVFRPDLENNPNLLQWYQKRGFEIKQPTPYDNPDIIAKLHMHL